MVVSDMDVDSCACKIVHFTLLLHQGRLCQQSSLTAGHLECPAVSWDKYEPHGFVYNLQSQQLVHHMTRLGRGF